MRSARLTLVLFCALTMTVAARGDEPPLVRIGVADSLFGEVPRPAVQASLALMQSLIQTQTGLKCQFFCVADGDELGERLAKKELELAVFQGIEYAWASAGRDDLEPLVIAVKHSRDLHAHLLVRADSPARSAADLRGQILGIAAASRPHCRLFADKVSRGREFFKGVVQAETAEDLLDDLVDGLVASALVDEAAYAGYARRKPARFQKLRELARSEKFPAAVIAFRRGALDAAQVKRFQDGMIAAADKIHGRQLLTLWRLRGFEAVPADYERNLAEIVRAYPRPSNVRNLVVKPMLPATVETRAVSAP